VRRIQRAGRGRTGVGGEPLQRNGSGQRAQAQCGAEPIEQGRKLGVGQTGVEERQLHPGSGRRVQQRHQLRPVLAPDDRALRPACHQGAVPPAHERIEIAVRRAAAFPDQRRRVGAQPRGARDGAFVTAHRGRASPEAGCARAREGRGPRRGRPPAGAPWQGPRPASGPRRGGRRRAAPLPDALGAVQ